MSNRILLTNMASALLPLLDRVVFVGGSIIELLIDDEAVASIRVTRDVDIIVGITTKANYYALINELKNLNFKEPMPLDDEPTPICRMEYKGMLLDVMPSDPSVLGFANKWYTPALIAPQIVCLTPDIDIKVINTPYFIATKLEAYTQRGQGDLLASHDMEDIITIYNGRNNIVDEIQQADYEVKKFIQAEFNKLLTTNEFKINCIPGHLVGEDPRRADIVYKRIINSIA